MSEYRIGFRTATADIEAWAAGRFGDVGLALTGTVPRTQGQRIWVALTPYQSLRLAAALIHFTLAAVILKPQGYEPPATTPEGPAPC